MHISAAKAKTLAMRDSFIRLLGRNTGMTKVLDENARKRAPGSFVKLSDGVTHFQWHGREDGPVIALVHGFSTPSFVWRGLLTPLMDDGFRILTYDHFGRGWSDRPNIAYSLEMYDRQLLDLIKSQKINGPVHLAGYSMGGLIAADFTNRHRDLVDRLFLIAPAGLKASLSNVPTLLKWPVIGPWLAENVMSKRLLADMQKPHNQGKAIPDLMERYHEQMAYPGYMRSLRSTLLHTPLLNGLNIYEQLARHAPKTGAIWGALDTTTPPDGAKTLQKLIPTTNVTITDDAFHAITYSHPEIVAEKIIAHLKG